MFIVDVTKNILFVIFSSAFCEVKNTSQSGDNPAYGLSALRRFFPNGHTDTQIPQMVASF